MISAFGVDHDGAISKGKTPLKKQRDRVLAKALRGEEFNPSQPYERYSAEKKRRHVAAEGAAYGGVAGAATATSTGAGYAKFLGTRTGKATTAAAKRKYRTGHPLNPHIKTAEKVGRYAAKHPRQTTGALLGASAIGAGAGMLHRFRQNEEQGISQGIGRIKAGSTYTGDQKKINNRKVSKRFRLATAASLADVNWGDPRIKRGLAFADKNKKKIAAGAAGFTGVGVAGGTVVGARNRRREANQLRTQSNFAKSVDSRLTHNWTPVGSARIDWSPKQKRQKGEQKWAVRGRRKSKGEQRKERARNTIRGGLGGGLGSAALTGVMGGGKKGAAQMAGAGGAIGAGLGAFERVKPVDQYAVRTRD